MAEEIELKFIVEDYGKMLRKILSICKFLKTAYEITVMYDNKERGLFKEDARLRLRKIKNVDTNEETCELSYKKPKTREGIKIEEENEVQVSSFEEAEAILNKLGFNKVSSYSRLRDTFTKDNCKITLDTFPFGNILEIEGDKDKIENIALELGLNLKDNTTKSCDDVYADICKKRGEKIEEHIIFNKISFSKALDLRKPLLK